MGERRFEREMDIKEILDHLPHRFPFLLVDRVVSMTPGESIRGFKCVTINEPFFVGHFPSTPVMPGVLIVEAMAQLSGILAFKTHGRRPTEDGSLYLLGAVENARFKRPVVPGDRLDLEAKLKFDRRGVMKFECTAHVDGELASTAEVTCVEKLGNAAARGAAG
jgi:3-hydroxyacyl-[acyl-carrier-protein] dehydratase